MVKKSHKCKCWSCKLSPKIRKLEKSLNPAQVKSFRAIVDELYERLEADSTDLGVLEAKIDGTWPKEEDEGYYHKVGDNLYLIDSTKVESE